MTAIPGSSGVRQGGLHALRRRLADGRALLQIGSAALDPLRPLLANLIVIRRCNLSCGYCHEYDRTSPPVTLALLKERIEHLERLRTVFVTLTGGEPLLHPDLAEITAYVRERGMTPLVNTNGYLLTKERILALGRAGLHGMQISIDNVEPNETTVKSLRPLRPKLQLLAELATFRVRVSTVLGSGSPDQAIAVARAALELGFESKCQLARDQDGVLIPLDERTMRAYEAIRRIGRRSPLYLSEDFQVELVRHGTVDWKCRAGARYFHVCEDGLVHFCASRHGSPGKPIASYGASDILQAFHLPKRCAAACTQPYAHQLSRIDALRPQRPSIGGRDERPADRVRLPVVPPERSAADRGP